MAISDRITAITNHLTYDWNSIDRLGLHTNILPKEYTQVNYIESNGTQYIDTGVNADNKLDTILDMAFTSPTNSNQNIGAISIDDSTTVRYHILCDGSQNNNFRMYTKTNYVGVGTLDANRHTFEFDCTNGKVYFDGTAYNKDTTNFDVGLNFWLFGRNSTSTIYYSNVKQYGCKMYYNNVLVRDFIPCFRNTDNEVGLYDIINDAFYTNQGTGSFTYGRVQEQHIDKNIENIKKPLNLFYNEVSNKTDLSVNGVVGRTSQESTTGKNLLPNNLTSGSLNGVTYVVNEDKSISLSGMASARTEPYLYNDSSHPITFKAGTYKNTSSLPIILYANGYILIDVNSTTTLAEDRQVTIAYFRIEYTGTTLNETYYPQIISSSTTDESYEQYTGNQPSPSPDYPQPINNLSGNVAYNVVGKNFFNENYYSDKTKYEKYGNYYAFAELPNYFKTKFYANVFLKGISNDLTICFNDDKSIPSNDKKVLNAGVINSNVEFDFTNAEKVYIGIGNGLGIDLDTDIDNIFNNYNIMCTLSLDVPYEPYIEPKTVTIPLGDIELCDIDTYEDKIYSNNGRFYLEKNIGKVTLNGSEDWDVVNAYDRDYFYTTISDILVSTNNNELANLITNYYNSYTQTDLVASNVSNYGVGRRTNQKQILLRNIDITTVADFKIWLSTHNTIVYYPYATPTTTEITTSNYPQLYAVLKQIQDYLTSYKINKEFILGYSSPEIEY